MWDERLAMTSLAGELKRLEDNFADAKFPKQLRASITDIIHEESVPGSSTSSREAQRQGALLAETLSRAVFASSWAGSSFMNELTNTIYSLDHLSPAVGFTTLSEEGTALEHPSFRDQEEAQRRWSVEARDYEQSRPLAQALEQIRHICSAYWQRQFRPKAK